MPTSVLDAIKLGCWNFEPDETVASEFDATKAMPGTKAKVDVLADRLRRGLPLWHDDDRLDYDE